MSFKRSKVHPPRPEPAVLTTWMAGLGFNFAAIPDTRADIEPTLLAASEVGMEEGDLRVLSVLTSWLGVHLAHVNAARLVGMVESTSAARVRAYWAAISRWQAKDRRLARLQAAYAGPTLPLLEVGNAFQLGRRGEDLRFRGSALAVPDGVLRERPSDVLTPEELIRRHAGYRNRVLLGPSWRAQLWTLLQQTPDLTPAEAARQAGCAFATAWEVVQDFRMFHRAYVEP